MILPGAPKAEATPEEPTVARIHELARACGHSRLANFDPEDLTSWKRDMAELTGVRYAGVGF